MAISGPWKACESVHLSVPLVGRPEYTVSGAHILALEGHTEQVISVGFFLTVCEWYRVRLISHCNCGIMSGTQIMIPTGHSIRPTCIALSPDGLRHAHMIAQCGCGMLFLGRLLRNLKAIPTLLILVSCSTDCTVRLCDGVTGIHIATLKGHTSAVGRVAFSSDRMVSWSIDGTVRVWDVLSDARAATLEFHPGRVTSIAFSADGLQVASSSSDFTLKYGMPCQMLTLRHSQDIAARCGLQSFPQTSCDWRCVRMIAQSGLGIQCQACALNSRAFH